MSGDPETIYVLARRTLLDALEALGPHRTAVILVGAQAVYLHTGEGDIAVAPFTTDGDLVIDPRALQSDPKLQEVFEKAGFRRTDQVGIWAVSQPLGETETDVTVDLLVPALLGGDGSRAARLGDHGKNMARKVKGLEGALVDKEVRSIAALEEGDRRAFEVWVAGPAALLVAKAHKLKDRAGSRRANDKDALDVLRLLRAIPTATLAARLRQLLRDAMAGPVTREAIDYLQQDFSNASASGPTMAARSVGLLEDPETIAASCAVLTMDLLRAVRAGREA